MIEEKFIDFRKTKKISQTYKEATSLALDEKNIEQKIKIWSNFLSESLKKLDKDNEDNNLLKKVRTHLEELKTISKKRLKKRQKNFFLDFLFSHEKKFKRLCAMLNLEIDYKNEIYSQYGDCPAKLVDIDYDNVTFDLIFEQSMRYPKNYFAKITLQAFDNKNIFIGANSDYLIFTSDTKKALKQIYVPNAAKEATKYKLIITFAKNSSI